MYIRRRPSSSSKLAGSTAMTWNRMHLLLLLQKHRMIWNEIACHAPDWFHTIDWRFHANQAEAVLLLLLLLVVITVSAAADTSNRGCCLPHIWHMYMCIFGSVYVYLVLLYGAKGFRRIHLLPIFLFSGKPCVPLSSLLLQGLPLLPVHYKTRWMESVWWCSRSASFDVRSFSSSSCLY